MDKDKVNDVDTILKFQTVSVLSQMQNERRLFLHHRIHVYGLLFKKQLIFEKSRMTRLHRVPTRGKE